MTDGQKKRVSEVKALRIDAALTILGQCWEDYTTDALRERIAHAAAVLRGTVNPSELLRIIAPLKSRDLLSSDEHNA